MPGIYLVTCHPLYLHSFLPPSPQMAEVSCICARGPFLPRDTPCRSLKLASLTKAAWVARPAAQDRTGELRPLLASICLCGMGPSLAVLSLAPPPSRPLGVPKGVCKGLRKQGETLCQETWLYHPPIS